MPENPVEQQPPDVLAMVPAHNVLHDLAHNRFVIEGTFSVMTAPTFPWRSTPIAVYTAITNGHGRTPLMLRLVDVDEIKEPIAESHVVVEFADPLAVAEVIFASRTWFFQSRASIGCNCLVPASRYENAVYKSGRCLTSNDPFLRRTTPCHLPTNENLLS